ncbi:MAG: DUF1273 family protein, partial [Oscillospiraceae bacterium]|nr:DUF1273 family protein [Oscillospiraceae bacterium]
MYPCFTFILFLSELISIAVFGLHIIYFSLIIKLRNDFPQIRLILALPCPEQADKWNKSQIALYEKIIANADIVHYVSG